MNVKKNLWLIIIFCSLGIILLASCKSEPTLASPSVPGIIVGLDDSTCPGISLKAGDQITWTNQDEQEYIIQVYDAKGEPGFNSGTLLAGDSTTLTLNEPGSYTYSCTTDGTPTGIITVNP